MQEKSRNEKILNDINQKAALHSSLALSKLINKSIKMEVVKMQKISVDQLQPFFDLEEMVVGVYIPVRGNINGEFLLIFPEETTFFLLCDLLVGREMGLARKITEFDQATLKEIGNIIAGNYFSLLGNSLKLKIIGGEPAFSHNMFGAIKEQIISKYALEENKTYLVEFSFLFEYQTLRGYFMVLLKAKEVESLFNFQGHKKRVKD